jgi:hypothetical protein
MNNVPRVGIVGGHGAVGRSVARQLQVWRQFRIRIGGRNTLHGRAFVETLRGDAEWVLADVDDARSLESFCAGCDAVVNCAGPASFIGEKIGHAAFAAGAHYVDAGGRAAMDLPPAGRTALLAAGMYPGLSGLLPRFLAAREFDGVSRLTAYIGGCDRLSYIAAIDYLDSLGDRSGEANAAWLGGRRVCRALAREEERSVPFFPRSVVLQPYLTAEAERLAVSLGLSELRWYSVFDGQHVVDALSLAGSRQAAEFLVKATQMDLFGREPYQILLFEMTGTQGDASVRRSLVLKASGGAALTGVAAAAGVRAVLAGEIPDGVQDFADCMNPGIMVEYLRRSDVVLALEVFDDLLPTPEEGEF